MLEWIKVLGPILFSWPTAIIMGLLFFRKQIVHLFNKLTNAKISEAEIGPVKIKLEDLARQGEETLNIMNKISILMAQSRLLELETTEEKFGPVFTPEQLRKMKEHIQEFQKILQEAE
jgi:hypothetical protein